MSASETITKTRQKQIEGNVNDVIAKRVKSNPRVLSVLLFFILIVFAAITPRSSLAYEPLTFQQQALRMVDRVQDIFIRRGVCTRKQGDCQARELVLVGRSPSGIFISISETTEINIVNEVVDLCFHEYAENKHKMSIDLEIFKGPHRERVNKFFGKPKPYFQMTIKGEQ